MANDNIAKFGKRLLLSTVVTALVGGGCVNGPGNEKGAASELPVGGKADAHQETVDHGAIAFGEMGQGEITTSSGIHLWGFTIGEAGATVGIRTDIVDGHEPVDTVVYLFEASSNEESWGTELRRNDDCPATGDLYSCINSIHLDGGHYLVLVKGYSAWSTGWFGVGVECSGDGCSGDDEPACDDVSGTPTALWDQNGVDISPAGVFGRYPIASHDGEGGAFVAYLEDAEGGDSLRIHHVDSEGQVTMASEGLTLLTGLPVDDITSVRIEPDGQNGIFLSARVETQDPGNLTLMRIGQEGEMLWGADGLALLDGLNISNAQLVARGEGELTLIYNVREHDGSGSLRAQALSPDGQPLWQEPASIGDHTTATWNTSEPDGQGGMFVGWLARDGAASQRAYAAHIDRNGASLWQSPIAVSAESTEFNAWGLDIEPDGDGGLYLAWHTTDMENHATMGIYAAHVDASGERAWGDGGVVVFDWLRPTAHFPKVVASAEGPLVFWSQQHAGHRYVYTQRVNGDGTLAFQETGIEVAQRMSEKTLTGLEPDSCGGFVSVWMDSQMSPDGPIVNVGLQRLGSDGASTFDAYGMLLGDDRWQSYPHLTPLGPTSFLVAWASREGDWRYPYGAIQAQRIDIE